MLGAVIGRSGRGETSQHQRGVRRGKEPPSLSALLKYQPTPPLPSLRPFLSVRPKHPPPMRRKRRRRRRKSPATWKNNRQRRKEGMISSSRLKSAFSSSSSQLVIAKRKLGSSYSFLPSIGPGAVVRVAVVAVGVVEDDGGSGQFWADPHLI